MDVFSVANDSRIITFIKVAFFDLGGTLVGNKRDWIPGAKDTLTKMLQKGIRLGLISNTKNLSRPEILEILPKDFNMSLFENELVIFSSEVHIEKPNPEIFKLAIMRAGVKPSQCLFCTEELPHILVAKQQGMQTALLQAPPKSDIEKLIERLTAEGLLPKKKGGTLMTKALGYVAIFALILTLGSTLLTIWLQLEPKKELFDLTKALLSWQVIAGGLAVGGGKTFQKEIKELVGRIAK